VDFFREIGVALHEEEHGKLFPDTHKARTVLDALLEEASRRGVELRGGVRVSGLETIDGGFGVSAGSWRLRARRVVLATGGLSLPKTGSDGGGYALARALGHSILPTTPALAPLLLSGPFHGPLSGVGHEAELRLVAPPNRPGRFRGSLLWTHFGASGPVVLDVSRHLLQARLMGSEPRLVASLLPEEDAASLDAILVEAARARPRSGLLTALEGRLPACVLRAVAEEQDVAPGFPLSQLPREQRRRLVLGLVERTLEVPDSRGYSFAEATAGGVPLSEVDLRTMESRCRPGLHLVGEMLDVDGRLGGFNFQWAWSSGYVAGTALARSD
jgi:predicted Rossmann fold flavoprotein